MPTPTTKPEETAESESAPKAPASAETSPVPTEVAPDSTIGSKGQGAFVMPIVHLSVPEVVVNIGFWGALAGAAAIGAIELPLAALIGAGVLVARHQHAR